MSRYRLVRLCPVVLTRLVFYRCLIIAVVVCGTIVLLSVPCSNVYSTPPYCTGISPAIRRFFLGQTEQSITQTYPELKLVGPGENIQVGELEIHIMSAIHRHDYPTPGAFNVVLVGWAHRDSVNLSFVCCLGNSRHVQQMVEVPAHPVFMDKRLKVVPMRYALYSCSINESSGGPSDTLEDGYRYVAFAENSCTVNTTASREIAPTSEGGHKLGVCTKIAYGDLDPERLVEWFEFAKVVGVDVVQVFYHIVSERALGVFKYYESTGFVILAPVNPAVMKGHPQRGFLRPRWEEQAWMDGTVICNDCVQRLSQYEFVVILDFDELLLPSPPYDTLLQVAEAAADRFPEAASFYIETYISLLEWPASNNQSAIFFLQHLERSESDQLDNFGHGKSSPKVIYRPLRVTAVNTHDLVAAVNFTKEYLPKETHKFLHYRGCKSLWDGCDIDHVTDREILRFESQWVQAISKLPLDQLGCRREYRRQVHRQANKIKT